MVNRINDIENNKYNLLGLIKQRKYSYCYLLYNKLCINKIGNYKLQQASLHPKPHHTILVICHVQIRSFTLAFSEFSVIGLSFNEKLKVHLPI